MAARNDSPASPGGRKKWLTLSLVGLGAVVAGVVLPQLLGATASLPPPAPAAKKTEKGGLVYTPPAWPEEPDPKAMLTRLGLGTVLVLGLCVGTLWLGKCWL